MRLIFYSVNLLKETIGDILDCVDKLWHTGNKDSRYENKNNNKKWYGEKIFSINIVNNSDLINEISIFTNYN